MSTAKLPILSFNKGLISDLVATRIDFPDRFMGGRVMDNFIPTTQGPIISRPGTLHCGEVYDSANPAHLVGMNTASGNHYLVEISQYLLRFWKRTGTLAAPLVGPNISISSVGGSSEVTFASGTSGMQVLWADHGLPPGAAIRFTTTGTLPSPLQADTDYYVQANADYRTNRFGIGLAPYDDTPVANPSGGSGTHTATHRLITTAAAHGLKNDDVITISGGTDGTPSINGTWVVKCVNSIPKSCTFDSTTNKVNITGHGYSTGDRVYFAMSQGGTLPTGLFSMAASTPSSTFWAVYSAIYEDANSIKLSANKDTTVKTFSSDGAGTFVMYNNSTPATRFQLSPLDGVMETNNVSYNEVNKTSMMNCQHFAGVTGTLVANWIGKHTPFTAAQLTLNNRLRLGTAVLGDSLFLTSASHWPKKLTVNSDYDWSFSDYCYGTRWVTSSHVATSTVMPKGYPYFWDGPYAETNSDPTVYIRQPSIKEGRLEDNVYFYGAQVVTSDEVGILLRNDCEDFSDKVRPAFGIITRVFPFTMTESVNQDTGVPGSVSGIDAKIDPLRDGSPKDKWITKWRKGLIHESKGYPEKIAFCEDRMCLGKFPNYPARMELSESSSYLTFTPTDARDTREVLDSNGISIQLTSQAVGQLQWIASSSEGVVMGSSGGAYLISGADGGGLIPGNLKQTMISNYGSENINPISFGDQIFYVESGGKRIRALSIGVKSEAYELSRLFFDSIPSPIVSWVFAYNPYPVIWAAMANGNLICVLLERQDNVMAGFTASIGGGSVKSVTTAKDSDGKDQIYFLVSRTINSTTKQYVETLSESPFVDLTILRANAVCSDSSVVITNSPASTTVSGLGHLEGRAVDVVADGVIVTGKTVASGAITLSTAASTIIVGLAYRPKFETLTVEAKPEQGMTLGNVKRVNQADFGFYRSLGGKIGRDSSNMNEIDFGTYTTTSVDYFTGVKKEVFNGDHTELARVRYEQVIPAPVCITFISPEVGIYD